MADNGAGLTRGIVGLVNKGQPRKSDDWGALSALGWGASLALDYLQTEPQVNAKQVASEGVSRYGKWELQGNSSRWSSIQIAGCQRIDCKC